MRRSIAIAALLTIVSACASPEVAPRPSSGPPAPVHGGRLTAALLSEPKDLDPLRVLDGVLEGAITRLIYEPLVSADPVTGEVMPGLATWSVSADGRTYEFQIGAAATWSDGSPIVADDFVTTVRALARSKAATLIGRGGVALIDGFADYQNGKATAVSGLRADGKHLTVRLSRAFCPFLSAMRLTPPIPAHVFGRYLSDLDVSKNADDAAEQMGPPISSGPFVLTEWRRGEQILLRANDLYWRGRPLLDELAFRIVDPSSLTALFRSGVVQLGWGAFRASMAHQLESDPAFRVLRSASPGYTFIGWNTRSETVPALRDKTVRQALAYGFDVDLALQRILDGEGVITRQEMYPSSWAFTPGLNEYRYDPMKAEQLIRSAGYVKGADGIYARDGHQLAFTIETNDGNDVRARIVQLAADQYAAIGVRVTPKLQPFATLTKRLLEGDPGIEAFVLGWSSVADPFVSSFIWASPTTPRGVPGNLAGFTDPDLDRAIAQGRFGPECDTAQRRRAAETVDRIVNEAQPYDFLFTSNTFVVMSARVHGITSGSYVPVADAHLWWLAPAK